MSKSAILKTLHYADLFDYPLTAGEIKKFLVEPVGSALEKTLSQMSADLKQISADGVFYCLPGREEIIKLRKRRERWSEPKLKKAKRVASFLKFIPWIKLVGVTGALAVENSNKDDDIDLMIITSSKRLWLTRGLVVTFLLLTRQYRRPGKVKDMICPNLMLSENALEFPDRYLFTAHEIVQMRPIFDRDDTYQKFISANRWIWNFLPNAKRGQKSEDGGQIQKTENRNRKSVFRRLSSKSALGSRSSVFTPLETLAYYLQLSYMKKKKTVEITTPSIIRFHPRDARRRVLDEYQRRVYDLPK